VFQVQRHAIDIPLPQTVSTADFSDGLDVEQQLAEKGRSLGGGLPVGTGKGTPAQIGYLMRVVYPRSPLCHT